MKYEEVFPIGKIEAEESFRSNDPTKICEAMVAIAFYEQDWKWAQDKCLDFFLADNYMVSSLAAICLGHIARVNGKLEKEKVIKILMGRINDNEISGYIEDALGDISIFMK